MPFIAEPPALPLSQNEMAAINKAMNHLLQQYKLPTADDDTAAWRSALVVIMKGLAGELSATVSEANFIPFRAILKLIGQLDDDKIKEWQSEVKDLAC